MHRCLEWEAIGKKRGDKSVRWPWEQLISCQQERTLLSRFSTFVDHRCSQEARGRDAGLAAAFPQLLSSRQRYTDPILIMKRVIHHQATNTIDRRRLTVDAACFLIWIGGSKFRNWVLWCYVKVDLQCFEYLIGFAAVIFPPLLVVDVLIFPPSLLGRSD